MTNLSSTIKTIQNIMRKDSGVDGDAQRIGQLSWMLFLKIFSDSEENKDLKRHIGKGYLMKISYTYIDEEYLDGVELFLYNYYKPTFNKQSPPGDKQISCNLPNVRKYNHY